MDTLSILYYFEAHFGTQRDQVWELQAFDCQFGGSFGVLKSVKFEVWKATFCCEATSCLWFLSIKLLSSTLMIEYIYAKHTFGPRRTIISERPHRNQQNDQHAIARQFVCNSRIEFIMHFATLNIISCNTLIISMAPSPAVTPGEVR